MNDKPTESELLKDPNKVLDDAYNNGVDDAIKVVQHYSEIGYDHHALGAIISQLLKLKSNDSR